MGGITSEYLYPYRSAFGDNFNCSYDSEKMPSAAEVHGYTQLGVNSHDDLLQAVAEKGLKPLAKIIGWGHAGVEPNVMGLGPVKAVPVALARAGLSLDQMDVIESNEAFAAQACGVAKELGFDPAKTNPNGSGISLGHPIGATGAILTIKAAYELRRTGGRYALVTMCIGGGQGIAMVIEAVA